MHHRCGWTGFLTFSARLLLGHKIVTYLKRSYVESANYTDYILSRCMALCIVDKVTEQQTCTDQNLLTMQYSRLIYPIYCALSELVTLLLGQRLRVHSLARLVSPYGT